MLVEVDKDEAVIGVGMAGGTRVAWGKREIKLAEPGIAFER